MQNNTKRTVFFVSESTGITAETLGHSLLSQFPHIEFTYLQRSFIDSEKKANALVQEIAEISDTEGFRPLVFATMPEKEINQILMRIQIIFPS